MNYAGEVRQRPLLFLFVSLLPALASCTRSAGLFSEQNARVHVSMLAGTIGSRPVGSEANARARAYLIDQLKLYGYDVRVQETDASRPELGRTARIANIIATLNGQRPEAIGIVAHYDSAPESPGAGDDGLGVAVSLETARVIAERPNRQWTTFVLMTDGEEAGLMGAAALVTDRVIAANLRAYVNVEAAGSDGSAVLFQTGPGNGWLTSAWSTSAPHPRGGSFGIEIYRRLPNDTDFTILARNNFPGLNLAAVDDGYSYHTARDTPERLTSRSLRMTGENVVAIATMLDGIDITKRERWEATYFDIGRVSALSYGMIVSWIVAAAALVFGLIACSRVVSAAISLDGPFRWIFTALWTVVGAVVATAAMVGTTWGLREAREVYHPWYAHPDRLFVLLTVVGLSVAWAVARVGAALPARVRSIRDPLVVWSVALPIWIILAAAATWLAPNAAYLWTLPLLAASLLIFATAPERADLVRMVSIVVLAVTGTLWLQNTVDLLRFSTAVFGRLPIITPVYVYAAILAAGAVMIMPPLVAIAIRSTPVGRPALISAVCLVAIAVATGAAVLAPAYTYEHPLRRHVRALQEPGSTMSVWEIGSIEPGVDVNPGAPPGWNLRTDMYQSSVPWGRFSDPFVFRTNGPSLGPPPAAIAGFTVTPAANSVDVSVSVVPKRSTLAVSFVLPTGLSPSRSNLPGVPRLGQWTATFVAAPTEGIAWRATFRSAEANRLRDIRIVVTDSGFPDGGGWQRLPGWLPQDRAVWTASATWVIPAAEVAALEPVPPLR